MLGDYQCKALYITWWRVIS